MKKVRANVVLCLIAMGIAFSSVAMGISLRKERDRKRAPDFELKSADGKTVRLSDFAGKALLIDLWATWCLPCRDSMPWLNQLGEKYRSEGFEVLGISIDEGGWTVVKPFIDKLQITYPVVIGNKRIAYLYGDPPSLPVAFFIDRKGRVAAIDAGTPSRKEYEKLIRILLGS